MLCTVIKVRTAWYKGKTGGLSLDRTSLSSYVMKMITAQGHNITVSTEQANICKILDATVPLAQSTYLININLYYHVPTDSGVKQAWSKPWYCHTRSPGGSLYHKGHVTFKNNLIIRFNFHTYKNGVLIIPMVPSCFVVKWKSICERPL